MPQVHTVLSATDWKMLRRQYTVLVELTHVVNAEYEGHLDGLLTFIDALRDAAVDDGIVTPDQAFGEED